MGSVLRCSGVPSSPPGTAISNCQLLPFSQAPAMNNDYIAILATNNYLFIASGQALYLYTIGGTFIASQSGPFVDVRRDESGNLYAATSSALYRVTATSTSLTATLWAGTENPSCDVVYGNTDGLNPTFCGICRIFPFSENEIYMTMPTANIVRALQLPPVHVTIFFGRTPFPFGMVGADTEIIPGLEDYISQYIRANVNADDAALQAAYPPSLNRSASMLDPDTWNTYFTVDVPQQAYDNTTTDPEIWGANFWPTLTALEAYYNLTDEVVYGDRNVMPTCNRTKMDLVERDVATRAREVLGYPLVYTNRTTNTTAQNVSGIKLLLPSSFNNETTSEIIANTNFTEVYLQSVAAHYPADRHLTLNFTSEHYHFDRLNEAQQQQVRFLIQQKLKNALATCGADPAYNNSAGNGSTMAAEVGVPKGDITTNGIGGGNGAELICVPTVGITNQSRVRVPGSQYDDFDYSVYVPEGYGFTGDQLHTCFNDIDWSDIADYVDGQMTKKKKKCDTGCIVGIAVAAAVVACILIVILVVLTSKRRRLAAVVAPPAEKDPGQPGFSSTVDLDEAENPLRS
ncbi:hypothetical protein AGDE_08235 [Angomonas deanei]|nr:hypothetical protein AGDE_08235 [Angomonas deanei]|eukprot:EPY33535.1 hypothetical protein AGDE_08235 [Angomonas deanei]